MLYQGLDRVLRLSDKDSPVVIQSDGKTLSIASRALHHGVLYTSQQEADPFKVILSAESARQINKSFSGEEFTPGEGIVTVGSGDNNAIFTTLEGGTNDILKPMTHFAMNDSFRVDPKEIHLLYSGAKHASNSPSVGDVRFKGFHFSYFGNGMEVMASDANVISLHQTSLPGSPKERLTVINNPAIIEVFAATKEAKSLEIAVSSVLSVLATFQDGTLKVVSSLVKGEPTPYSAVLDRVTKANTHEYMFKRNDFMDAIEKLSFFTSEASRFRLSMGIEDEMCTFSSYEKHTRGMGTFSAPISHLSGDKNSWKLGINLAYFLPFLKSTPQQEIIMKLGGDKLPILFEMDGSKEIITVFTTA